MVLLVAQIRRLLGEPNNRSSLSDRDHTLGKGRFESSGLAGDDAPFGSYKVCQRLA